MIISKSQWARIQPRGNAYGNFGAPDMSAEADSFVKDVVAAYYQAREAAASGFDIFLTGNLAQIQYNLEHTALPAISNWSGELLAECKAGTRDWASWFRTGQTYADLCYSYVEDAGDAGLVAFLKQMTGGIAVTVANVLKRLGAVADAVTDPNKTLLPFWIKAVLVIGVIGYATSNTSRLVGR